LKKYIKLLTFTIIFAIIFSATVFAQSGWEATSGFNITQVTLDTYNTTIDDLNESISHIPYNTNIKEMENIDKVPMIFFGANNKVNKKYDIDLYYENIFGEVETTFDSTNGVLPLGGEATYNLEADSNTGIIEVDLKGVSAIINYRLSENWGVGGGLFLSIEI